jgi:hypothetical protein
MKRTIRGVGPVLLLFVAAGMLGGCATTKQARSVEEPKGVLLTDYSMLHPGKKGQALEVYKNDKVDWAKYKKVIVEPVLFPKPENASSEQLADLQKLANNFQVNLIEELGKDYQIVAAPGPDTLRVQTAFFDPEKKHVVADFLSAVVPIGAAVSLTKDFATGKPMAVGGVSGEAKITDSQSGELLGAAVDSRVGEKYGKGMFDSWAEANAAMVYWAKRMRYALCEARGGSDCVAPE